MTVVGTAPPLAVFWSRQLDDYVVALSVSCDGALVAVGTSAGSIYALESATGKVLFEREAHSGGVLACAFSPRQPLLATSGHDGYARLFDASGRERGSVSGGAAWVEHLAWSPSGDYLATTSGRTARVWTRDAKPAFEIDHQRFQLIDVQRCCPCSSRAAYRHSSCLNTDQSVPSLFARYHPTVCRREANLQEPSSIQHDGRLTSAATLPIMERL